MTAKRQPVIAYCFQEGRIFYTTDEAPNGALVILSHPDAALIIEPIARWSYPQKDEAGLPIQGSSFPLVPGLPETDEPSRKIDHLSAFVEQIQRRIDQSLKVNRRNEFGVKDQSNCYRTYNGVLHMNAQDVCGPGAHKNVRSAAQALARRYRDAGYTARIEAQDNRTWWRVFVDASAFYRAADTTPPWYIDDKKGPDNGPF